MPELEYFVVAESVSVDQATNRISLFHVLEEIHSAGFPVVIPRVAVVAHWNAREGDLNTDFQMGVCITLAEDPAKDFNLNFRMVRPRQRTIANFVALEVTKPGTMTIELKLNGKHKAFHIVDVRKLEH